MSGGNGLANSGIIPDIHFQERLFALLDPLGHLAPVVGVHGNDEPDEAKRDLPEQQPLMIGGVGGLLWHSHVPAISKHAGVTLFNPGALAWGSFLTRQSPQTVGRLRVQTVIPIDRRPFDSGRILRQDMIDAVRCSKLVAESDRAKWLAVLERR
jgi:hypothetical protein